MSGPEIERLIFHWPAAVRAATPGSWAHGFALSIAKKASAKPWWRPTPKEAQVMARMVSDLFTHPAVRDLQLIEEG